MNIIVCSHAVPIMIFDSHSFQQNVIPCLINICFFLMSSNVSNILNHWPAWFIMVLKEENIY